MNHNPMNIKTESFRRGKVHSLRVLEVVQVTLGQPTRAALTAADGLKWHIQPFSVTSSSSSPQVLEVAVAALRVRPIACARRAHKLFVQCRPGLQL